MDGIVWKWEIAFAKKIKAVGILSGLKNYETQKSSTEVPFRFVVFLGRGNKCWHCWGWTQRSWWVPVPVGFLIFHDKCRDDTCAAVVGGQCKVECVFFIPLQSSFLP